MSSDTRFRVNQLYHTSDTAAPHYDTLETAVLHAVAFAMHSGNTFAVSVRSTQLFSVSPNTIDWRRVNGEHILAVKAMAHDLVPNVDEVIPDCKKEGMS